MVEFLPVSLTIAGAALLSIGLYYTNKIISELTPAPMHWRILSVLIIFFIAGYLWFAIRIIDEPVSWLGLTVAAIFFGGGWFVFIVMNLSVRTIRDTKQTAALQAQHDQVMASQQRLQAILDHAAEGIFTFDAGGMIDSFNHVAEALFGYREQEIVGKPIGSLVVCNGRGRNQSDSQDPMPELKRLLNREGEVMGRHQDGRLFPISIKISAMMHGGQLFYSGLVADISGRKMLIDNLRHLAEHDSLTGLYNRSYFQQELDRVVERARCRNGEPCSLLYIDLDNFKYINDTLGHAAGDRLLREIAAILNERARKSDLIARFGGDEFAVLLYCTTATMAVRVAESFHECIVRFRFMEMGQVVNVGCSIGVSAVTSETKSTAQALSQVDVACHLAKREGRNRVRLFGTEDAADLKNISLDMGWSQRIRDAIEHGRFALACQPIVDTCTHRIASYEILIRMVGDHRELILPGGFLPAAERFGLIKDIDQWVVTRAIDMLAKQRISAPSARYSVNLSAQTISDPKATEFIFEQLHAATLDPQALIFEITETAAISDLNAAKRFLARLHEIGCETALDDFGAGFSSFAYLQELPLDYVKIDGRFVRHMAQTPVDQAMVKSMNEIAHALGKKTVAEFVEDEETLRMLRQYGIDLVQGYHLGRPDVVVSPTSNGDVSASGSAGTQMPPSGLAFDREAH